MSQVAKDVIVCKHCNAAFTYKSDDIIHGGGICVSGVVNKTQKVECPKCRRDSLIKHNFGVRQIPSCGGYGR